MVVPGAGAVLGVLRALVWGIVLSPTIDPIVHKFKIVNFLEGEGYVIAIIFATELFVAMRAREGGRLQNYCRAVMLNLQGSGSRSSRPCPVSCRRGDYLAAVDVTEVLTRLRAAARGLASRRIVASWRGLTNRCSRRAISGSSLRSHFICSLAAELWR
jgi:hypothetical protein